MTPRLPAVPAAKLLKVLRACGFLVVRQSGSHVVPPAVALADRGEVLPAGVILDYDVDGNLVSVEILDASSRVSEAQKVEFQTVE